MISASLEVSLALWNDRDAQRAILGAVLNGPDEHLEHLHDVLSRDVAYGPAANIVLGELVARQELYDSPRSGSPASGEARS